MKLTFNWLKQYVDFDWSPEQLSERLTMLGLEVEGVHKVSGEFEGIVVGQVLTRDKVAGSDKLSVCKVADGKGERQVICGANNYKAGDKVPLIVPGASLPLKAGEKEPFTIKVRKVMGVESHGMLCSPQELGLPDDVDGLLILREDAKVGQPFAEYLGRKSGDVVYDLEITPNRPDWNSVVGIAREISALTGNPLRMPDVVIPPANASSETIDSLARVRLDDSELCPRYTARVVRGVKIGPSPDWLRQILEAVGLRSINNVVDVTNYVMLEIGQPLHAFDYHLLTGKPPTIVVRRAAEGESFTTLDGKKHELTANILLIADESKAVALAGVMGGQNSEINANTADVLIESAYFKPQNIRATSKKLELRTDSSYRFERGGDIGICDWASRRAAQLIVQTAGGKVLEQSIDAFPNPPTAKEITLRFTKTEELVGMPIPHEQQVTSLRRLGLITDWSVAGDQPIFRIPTFRVDIKREVDLIEEIVRLHGIDKIPSTPPRGAIGTNDFDAVYDEFAEAREILSGLGLNEAQGQTLISDASAKMVSSVNPEHLVYLENPLSSDMNVLRPSVLPGLLDALRHNVSHKNDDVALFEIGRVFSLVDGKTKEERRLGIALTGRRLASFWTGGDREATYDAYDLKGLVEDFLQQFGLKGMSYVRRENANTFFLESAGVELGKMTLGEIGQVSPVLAKRYDLRHAAFLAELNFDLLLARRNRDRSFKSLPAFPAIRRDIAMIVSETATHDAVLNTVRQTKTANLESVEVFDVFRGKNIPAGQKSLAYAFTYRSAERTLTDAEVNSAHEKVIQNLRQTLQATIRDA
jgi:phenylalanyl-tRNA synthetase beta chain